MISGDNLIAKKKSQDIKEFLFAAGHYYLKMWDVSTIERKVKEEEGRNGGCGNDY